jgi:two-component system, chemotaxis family, protein-glutamate methylesterase/glutaminase
MKGCNIVVIGASLIVGYDPVGLAAPAVPELMEVEHKLTAVEIYMAEEQQLQSLDSPSPLTCPECNGVLYQTYDDRLLRFRCRAGHAMSARALLVRLADERERGIWSATRSAAEADVLIESAHKLRTLLTEWAGSPLDFH